MFLLCTFYFQENNFTTNFRERSTSSNNGLYTNGYTSSMTSNSTAHMIEISHSSQSEFSMTIYNNTNGQTKTFNKEARDISTIQLREMKGIVFCNYINYI